MRPTTKTRDAAVKASEKNGFIPNNWISPAEKRNAATMIPRKTISLMTVRACFCLITIFFTGI